MTNLDRHEWEFSEAEKFAIGWLEGHGFQVTLTKRCVLADHFTLSREGVTDRFRLPLGDANIDYPRYMEAYGKAFDLICQLKAIREETGGPD